MKMKGEINFTIRMWRGYVRAFFVYGEGFVLFDIVELGYTHTKEGTLWISHF